MNLNEYSALDGLGLAELVRSGQLSARQACELAIAGVDAVNAEINAVITDYRDEIATLQSTPRRRSVACRSSSRTSGVSSVVAPRSAAPG